MNRIIVLLFLWITPMSIMAQSWSDEQLMNANTALNEIYLTSVEKEVILYINLARLYPKQFAEIEVETYEGTKKYGPYVKNSKYRSSLLKKLKSMKPVNALMPDKECYENALCFANESGKSGYVGHQRKKCPKKNYAECCSYGMDTGRDIALQWLIDHDVPKLGHRSICLDGIYSKIGISMQIHKKYETCAVAEFAP